MIYCPDCAGNNVNPFPRAGENAYKCLDCGNIFWNPIILDAIAPTTEQA